MTPRDFSIDVIRQLQGHGFTAYWAGGCVRDLLLKRPATDFDVATNATPEQVRGIFGTRRTLAVGESFGVIIVLGPKSAGQVEVATFRKDGQYLDGRRPSSIAFCDAEEDAQRRDFTINGMFYDPINEVVHDFVDGQTDLTHRTVRAIGDPHARMTEDKLRMLRAVRFASVLQFDLDSTTADAIRAMASQIVVVSAERIAQELRKLLPHRERVRGLRLLRDLDLLSIIMPEVQQTLVLHSEQLWEQTLMVLGAVHREGDSFAVALAVLMRHVPVADCGRHETPPHGTVQDFCKRLRFSNEELDHICWLVQQQSRLTHYRSLSLAQLKRLIIHPYFYELRRIEEVWDYITGNEIFGYESLDYYIQQTPLAEINPPELLTGRDLIQLGYAPGPDFRTWLDAIRDAQLNELIHTRDEALELLRTMQSHPGRPQ